MARSFASGDYIERASNTKFSMSQFACGAWIKTSASGFVSIMSRATAASASGFNLFIDSTTHALRVQAKAATAAADVTGTTVINDGNWHFVGVNLGITNGDPVRLIVDGRVDATGSVTQTWSFSAQPVRVGKPLDTFWANFVGTVSTPFFYSRNLSDGDWAALYRGAHPRDIAPGYLVATFEDIPGAVFDTSDNVICTLNGTTPVTSSSPEPLWSQTRDLWWQKFVREATASDVTLTPSLFTNSQSFFSPTVAPGAVNLAPSLYTNSQSFFAPTAAPGAVAVTPGLVTNAQTFFAPVAALGSINAGPSLVTNSQTFYAPTAQAGSVDLTPSLFNNDQTFFVAIVGTGALQLAPNLVTNGQTFFSPLIGRGPVDLAPTLYANSQTFFVPVVGRGAVNVAPALFSNAQTFFAPVLAPGSVNLAPSLSSNNQTFFSPLAVAGGSGIAPNKLTNTPQFYAPELTLGAGADLNLVAPLHLNAQTFFPPRLSGGNVSETIYGNVAPRFFRPLPEIGPRNISIHGSRMALNLSIINPVIVVDVVQSEMAALKIDNGIIGGRAFAWPVIPGAVIHGLPDMTEEELLMILEAV